LHNSLFNKYRESQAKRGHSIKVQGKVDVLALFIATGFGTGLLPLSPGTFGSLVGLLIAYLLFSCYNADFLLLQNALILASVIFAGVGIWSSARAEKIFNQKDASQIVIDEVCGQIISFVFLAASLGHSGRQWRWWMIVGFILFRLFDIFKPYPINRLQQITGGLGVMLDDILAGIYAAIVISLALFLTDY